MVSFGRRGARKLLAIGLVALALVALLNWLWDERSIRGITIGLPLGEVLVRLGTPDDVSEVQRPVPLASTCQGATDDVRRELLFRRHLRASLVVYLDESDHVSAVCRYWVGETVTH